MLSRLLAPLVCITALSLPACSQQPAAAPMASPPATASVTLGGKDITLHYNSPSLKSRTVGVEVAPYGQVWRTGANPATTVITTVDLKIGNLTVPAGTYTLFTLPGATTWQLIISKDVGEWGLDYKPAMDLGRTPMTGKTLPASQEVMSISFENTRGRSTELHVRWGTTDEFVPVTAK